MYIDNLTLASLAIFAGALGVFVYLCLYRNCITRESGNNSQDKD